MAKIRKSFPVDNASKFFDLQDQEGGDLFRPGRQPRGTDSGVDRLGRDFQSNDPIPEAGGPTGGLRDSWLGESGDISTGFKPMGAGEQPMIGGATRSNTSGNPTQEYIFSQPGSVATRVGPNFVLSPIDPGIAPAAPMENFAKSLRSRVAKGLGRGMFSDLILGGDTAGPIDPEVDALIQKALDNRAEIRKAAIAKAKRSLGQVVDDDELDEEKAASDEETDSATVGVHSQGKPTVTPQNIGNTPAGTGQRYVGGDNTEDEKQKQTAKSGGIWQAHLARKAARTGALTTKRQNGGRLDGGCI